MLEFEFHVADSLRRDHHRRSQHPRRKKPMSIKLKLKADLRLAISLPSRMIMDAMEAQRYKLPDPITLANGELRQQAVTAPEHLLKALLKCFPDNKIVEDARNWIRKDAKGNKNQKQANSHIQDVVEHSNVLESRDINRNVAIDRHSFNEEWNKKTKAYPGRWTF